MLALRTCHANLSAYNDFRWPESGPVWCPDWEETPRCGNGLHGLLWGEGDGSLLDWASDAKWLVVEIDETAVIDLGGKIKFPSGVVVHCGDRVSSTQFLMQHGPSNKAIAGARQDSPGSATQKGGYHSTQKAGDGSTQKAGHGSVMIIRYLDWEHNAYRVATAIVGENGIKPDTWYRFNCESGEFVEIPDSEMEGK